MGVVECDFLHYELLFGEPFCKTFERRAPVVYLSNFRQIIKRHITLHYQLEQIWYVASLLMFLDDLL